MTNAFDALMAGINTAGVPATALPTNVAFDVIAMAEGYDYKPYQRDALKHLFRDSTAPYTYGYVGLDMGLGKTPVGLGVAASVAAAGIKPTLIVVPPSLRTNWVREAGKFFPWLTVSTIQGRGPEDGYTLPDVDVLIMGDSSLSGQGRRAKDSKVTTSWVDYLVGRIGALVVDEAHRFKNKSARSESLVKLATGVEVVSDQRGYKRRMPITRDGVAVTPPQVRVPMSGTMAPNGRNAEVANQVSLMGDAAWRDIGGQAAFWSYFTPKVDDFKRANDHQEELNALMAESWYFRRLRDDVEDLPNKGRSGIHLDGKGFAVKEYKQVETDLIEYLKEKQGGHVTKGQERAQAIVKLNHLRRLAGKCKIRSIVDHVLEILESSDDEGVFIVAEHRDVMDSLLLSLAKYQPACVRGGMSDADKDREVTAFITGETRVMVGQITAAGVGLTLHGEGRNRRVVIAQLPWTPAELKQAEDRLHRLGQTRDVFVEVALCAIEGTWTVDERLWGQLESKNFAASTLQDGVGENLLESIVDGVLDSYRS